MEVFFTLAGASMKAIRADARTLQLSVLEGRTFAFFLRTKKVSPKCVLPYGLKRGT